MKSKIFGIICALLFLVSACGKDEDTDNNEVVSVVAIWGNQNGEEFAYLTLLSNNTFLYAENDLSVSSSQENGLELGTYSYNSSKEEITFNIAYDDNAPGDGSGIGDIGTPVTFNASVLEGSTRLSLADGDLILDKIELTATSPVIGVWGVENGDEFSYLMLLSDNTFLYAENDLTVTSSAENGLEVGTFAYDPSKEELIFDIEYDDNAPGEDSGVGDTGASITLDAVLSNDNNTLTVAGLVLSKSL
ncbi:hypothetical protein [Roseivirga sp.]|uniref:hypothetical protein n=1 Tax=Roseivirga sp. TaxID=1964215 RepID=UPI002B26B9AF|nr:hypothetical protein [Roseivirga sp.]